MKLKKLPIVSFAGVDCLDDIQNHTYNELFVSGGFIVSDEYVLNPDFTTQGEWTLYAYTDLQSSHPALNPSEIIPVHTPHYSAWKD